MKMYKTRSWGHEIEEVEIVRKTSQSVYYMQNGKEQRELDTYYFDSKEEAKKSIIERESDKVAKKELLEITIKLF